MDFGQIISLISPELGIVLAACWVVGVILKKTPAVPDWSIIFAVTAFAIIMSCLLQDWTAESVLQGILIGAAAVYGNQLVKQATEAFRGGDEK